jgi:transposase
VHLTESCDEELPHLVTHVDTTEAPVSDVERLPAIQQGLAQAAVLPAEQLVDTGYISAENLVRSQQAYQIDLVGRMYENQQWQAKAHTGYDLAHFQIDWGAQVVTCPQGRQSVRWCETVTARGPLIHIDFAASDCTLCPVRALCTRAQSQPRGLTLQPQAAHEAVQTARSRQQTEDFRVRYATRAGIEGTLSQAVRAFGLRRARYRGLAKTHLQHLATASAINLSRLNNWLNDVPRSRTRQSAFAALMLAA